MGAVEQAKSLVNSLMKKSEDRTQELQRAIKSLENMKDRVSSTFQGTASDTEKKVASALEESITRFKEAVKAVEQSKKELEKCQGLL